MTVAKGPPFACCSVSNRQAIVGLAASSVRRSIAVEGTQLRQNSQSACFHRANFARLSAIPAARWDLRERQDAASAYKAGE